MEVQKIPKTNISIKPVTTGKTKKTIIPAIYEITGIAGAIASGINGYTNFHPEQEVMKIIVEQFEQSGAENIEIEGTKIVEFHYSIEDYNCDEQYNCVLKKPIDLSKLVDVYAKAGQTGLAIGLGAIGLGTILRLIGTKKENEHLKGIGKITNRIGGAYGLLRILAVKNGLNNMPYTIDSSSLKNGPYDLVTFSKEMGNSSIDIAPLIQQTNNALNTYIGVTLAGLIGTEIILGIYEYKQKRTPTKTIENYTGFNSTTEEF